MENLKDTFFIVAGNIEETVQLKPCFSKLLPPNVENVKFSKFNNE